MNKRYACAVIGLVALPAVAHEGHAPGEGHWHAADALVVVLALVATGALVWLRGRK